MIRYSGYISDFIQIGPKMGEKLNVRFPNACQELGSQYLVIRLIAKVMKTINKVMEVY